MCSVEDHAKLESLVKRCRRLGYYGRDEPTLSELFNEADSRLFNRVISNPEHVLQQFLTERHQTYNLRRRPMATKPLLKNVFIERTGFFIRAMYKHSY